MDRNAKIFVAGHRGLVGSALMRNLREKGYANFVTRTHAQLDLTSQAEVEAFFELEKPAYVFLAAAKVGGIHANNTYPAEFIRDNLAIQTNVTRRFGAGRQWVMSEPLMSPADSCGIRTQKNHDFVC